MTAQAKHLRPQTDRRLERTSETTVEGNLRLLLAEQGTRPPSSRYQQGYSIADSADGPLVSLVSILLGEAVKVGASDIHIEPFETTVRIRFRIDGWLQEFQAFPEKLAAPIASRLKIMANLDICEKRLPQDGSFTLTVNDQTSDFRMSTLPSRYGEKIVLRILAGKREQCNLSTIGLEALDLDKIRSAIRLPEGMVLVTGPTGSGKTTTLYAAISELNDVSTSVFTAEDPIEGPLPGVTQCQTNPGIGYTFASMLRSFLRQDPDVLFVGEIRDEETAEVSVKAALTGHLLLSTLHTNCAVSTIHRLIDMGIKPYVLSACLNCVIAQRLVRKLCPSCKEVQTVSPAIEKVFEPYPNKLDGAALFKPKGCPECRGVGYRGRTAVYEVLVMTDYVRSRITSAGSKNELKTVARESGMTPLFQAGLNSFTQGITSFEEVLGLGQEEMQTHETLPDVSTPLRV